MLLQRSVHPFCTKGCWVGHLKALCLASGLKLETYFPEVKVHAITEGRTSVNLQEKALIDI